MNKNLKAPYYLVIHCDQYTGNFDRKLIAYSIGKLNENEEKYEKEYIKAFWNTIGGSDIDCLKEYINVYYDYIKKPEALVADYNNILRLYDAYLYSTYQTIDDWKQFTFYNIGSFYKNKEYNCDTIFIQFTDLLPKEIEKIVIYRIKEFFKVHEYIENYIWICQFGVPKNSTNNINLLDLELIDANYNIIKKYI